ncbi:MAG TPA: hypothetical protein VNS22_26295 [Geminicoccus sp.]|uniref:hypothetical protein n=1 Tax=Geminicoccus sp. TaxID=2024832 RepID=UPI002D15416B|nr:hypothetical protein [Geminicoccus sp.]HWL71871.1 hypothetical protein [Geminicoccus sp.]
MRAARQPVRAADGDNDSFHINMGSERCSFIDHGPGKEGNGTSNDDYVESWNTCADKHGGKGEGRKIVRDPFGSVKRNGLIDLKIYEFDGPNDQNSGPCNWGSHRRTGR